MNIGPKMAFILWRWLHDPELHELLEFERRIVAGKGAAAA
jgi:hypothetical protein